MSILNNSLLLGAPAGSTQYQVQRSLRFNSSDSAYLSRTPASAGNRKTWTWAAWVKRSALGSFQMIFGGGTTSNDTDQFVVYFASGDTLRITSGVTIFRETSQVFRDPSSWYHFVIAVDTTQSTANDRIKFYVNGTQVTTFSTTNNPTQNADTGINTTTFHAIGRNSLTPEYYFSGYLSDIYFVDGQQLTPSSLVEVSATTGQLIPKQYTGSFGTNGFWLKFSDNSAATATTLGKDYSGNNNNWSPSNLSVTAGAGNDSLVDTPTSYGTDTSVGGEVRGNYCTLNPLDRNTNFALSNGNLDGSTGTGTWRGARGTFGVTSGKWYFECIAGSPDTMVGIADATTPITDPTFPGYTTYSYGYYGQGGVKYNNNVGTAYGSGYTTNDVIGVAFDADNGRVFFSKNGTWQASGDPAAGTNAAFTGLTGRVFFPMLATYSNVVANFGQRPWAYTPPANYRPLVDTLLPTPAVAKPNTVFDTVLYTADVNGGKTISMPGGFSPDLVWIKNRDNVERHYLIDKVRGNSTFLNSNTTDNETGAASILVGTTMTLDNSSYTITDSNWANGELYFQNRTYVSWCWDAGSSTVTNTQGSITSTVRANASAGFSVVTYTGNGTAGATIGHGLGTTPSLIITKSRNNSSNWAVQHASLGGTTVLWLNLTNAQFANSSYWNNTNPTSTVFTVGNTNEVNISTWTYVAYCFAPVSGLSAFGSYVGNGSASDGPFVYTGHRSRFVLIKRTDAADNWVILDTARNTYNSLGEYLLPNTADGGASTTLLDINSNGFKLRFSGTTLNASGGTYIYAAFAESPFAYSRAR